MHIITVTVWTLDLRDYLIFTDREKDRKCFVAVFTDIFICRHKIPPSSHRALSLSIIS